MIKTTSFALPRSSQKADRPSDKRAVRHNAIKAAKAREAVQAPVNPFALPTPAPEITAAQARELLQAAAPKNNKRPASLTSPTALPKPSPVVTTSVPVMTTASKPAKPAAKAPRTKAAPAPAESVIAPTPVAYAPEVPTPSPAPVAVAITPAKAAATAKKARRARVPANLAEQYGQNISKRVENGIEDVPADEDTPKKRLTRTERQARRELMNLDDDLLARLQRAHNAVPSAKPVKRPKGWRFDCGRCGQTSYFQTNGALCNCGALAIKD